MAKQKEAGAGRGFLNPKPVGMSDEDYVTPEQDYEMRKARAERKTQEKTDKAYKEASEMKKGGKVKRYNGEEESFVEAGSGVSEKPGGGRFDEDTYARARRFLERGGEEEAPKPVAKARPKPAVVAAPAPARKATAEDIPTGGYPPAPEGESASGSELGRNLKNIASAMAPGAAGRAAPAIGRGLGALASSAKSGFQAGRAEAAKERAEKAAQLAGEMRRGQRGTKFESAAKPKPRATKKFNEDEMSTEFKKGGAVRGWGMARGARKAKIY